MDTSILVTLVTAIASTLAATLLTVLKTFIDKNKKETEEKEVKDDVENVISKIITIQKEENNDDVLALMIRNVGELREYYVINKQQARNAFSAALFISILGFILFATGIALTYIYNTDKAIQYSTIGGAIVEIIAGLFFWLYSKATKQINIFHSSLLKTEKFLTAIQLVDKIAVENRDKAYTYIIEKIIDNNSGDTLIVGSKD